MLLVDHHMMCGSSLQCHAIRLKNYTLNQTIHSDACWDHPSSLDSEATHFATLEDHHKPVCSMANSYQTHQLPEALQEGAPHHIEPISQDKQCVFFKKQSIDGIPSFWRICRSFGQFLSNLGWSAIRRQTRIYVELIALRGCPDKYDHTCAL